MYTLLFSLISVFFAGIGYGALLDRKNKVTMGEKGIIGLFFTGFIAILLHFFIPLSQTVSFIYLGIGLLLFVIFSIKKRIQFQKELVILLFLGLILTLFFSYYAILPYDTGLYHLQTIIWNKTHALSLGLANFHGRFGFNSVWFSINALFGINQQAYFVLNGILFLYVCLSFIEYIFDKRESGRIILSALNIFFLILFLIPLSTIYVGNNLFASPSNDLPASLLILYCTFLFICPKKHESHLALLIATLTLLIKMNSLPLFIVTAIYYIFQKNKSLKVFVISALFILIWSVQNIFISGCLVYPLQPTCIYKLPWAVTQQQVRDESTITINWARSPGLTVKNIDNTNWIKPWIVRMLHTRFTDFYLGAFGAIALFFVIISFLGHRVKSKTFSSSLLSLSISVLGVIYWFFTAPDLRFGVGYLLSLLAVIAYVIFSTFTSDEFLEKKILQYSIIFGSALIFSFVLIFNRNTFLWMINHGGRVNLPAVNTVELSKVVTQNGQEYYVPKTGDQCWDITKMCTPNTNDKIKWSINGNRYYFSIKK